VFKKLNRVFKSVSLYPSISILNLKNWKWKTMKSKNLIIACVWTFVIVLVAGFLLAGILWTDYNMVTNAFNVGLLFFFIALAFTGAIVYLTPGNINGETELIGELQNIRSKLDKLADEVKQMKKTFD